MSSYEPREIKYVVIDGGFPILINPALSHSDVVHTRSVEAAGLCTIAPGKNLIEVRCHGASKTLQVAARPEVDADLIWRMLLGENAPKYLIAHSGWAIMADWRLSRKEIAGDRAVWGAGNFRVSRNPDSEGCPLQVDCWGECPQLRKKANPGEDADFIRLTLVECRPW